MKIFSFMSSIEEGKYNGSDTYASGTIMVDSYRIRDWNDSGWGNITYDVGFTYSSNVAATILAQQVGREKLLDYYNALGFGQKTGLELYGELDGKVRFIGENAHLCRGRKAFTLVGSVNESKKLVCESFTYNYRAKNADGKSTRVYGKVNRNK
jgi:cell division protein FtsI/penicillin-binding protein 2